MMRRVLVHGSRILLLALLAVPGGLVDGVPVVSSDPPAAYAADEIQPAVETPAPAVEGTEKPWTVRFLAPTVLAIGVLSVVAAAGFYLVRVRGRYTVSE